MDIQLVDWLEIRVFRSNSRIEDFDCRRKIFTTELQLISVGVREADSVFTPTKYQRALNLRNNAFAPHYFYVLGAIYLQMEVNWKYQEHI